MDPGATEHRLVPRGLVGLARVLEGPPLEAPCGSVRLGRGRDQPVSGMSQGPASRWLRFPERGLTPSTAA
eukprot:3533993-Alexandrium_andersonii.AAC.1